MADFKGGDVVLVPLPVTPEMIVWALPGRTGDIPYADVEALVDAEFGDRIGTMTQLEQDATAAAGTATTKAGEATTAATTATTKAGEATTAASTATSAMNTATSAASTATTQAGDAADSATLAQQYVDSFDLTMDATTGAPGSAGSVTVTGAGPAYHAAFVIPEGEQGDPGPPGEVSQAELDAAVATLVDNAPEALNTLSELATSLGNDPNFATTVSTEIGLRAKTTDVNAALAGKSDVGHTHTTAQVTGLDTALAGKADTSHSHTKAQVGLGSVDNTSDAAKPVSTATAAAIDAKIQLVSSFPASPTAGVLYLKAE